MVDSSGHPKYRAVEMHTLHPSDSLLKLTVAATFAEVWLAKEGHDGPVGMNLLTKIELPTLPSLYGALLAGVDYIIMGAGIPRAIPQCLDLLAQHQTCSIPITVEGATPGTFRSTFNPQEVRPAESLRHPPARE